MSSPEQPLIVQSDFTILLEVDNPRFADARDQLARFAELLKSPEHMHTYRIGPLSLWNAASAGMQADEIVEALDTYGKFPLPPNVEEEIRSQIGRYGRLRLLPGDPGGPLHLEAADDLIVNEILHHKKIAPHIQGRADRKTLLVAPDARGLVKQALIRLGWPVEDLAGYTDGAPMPLRITNLELRDYQRQAAEAFHARGSATGGSGVLVLPCGSGKTIIGIGIMAHLQMQTLILVPNVAAIHQWREELLHGTDIRAEDIGEYSGDTKVIKPVTIATYQILTWRKKKTDPFVHFALFQEHDWGLIVYDEVHLLPAPVFRAVADIQARRRLGLTATLVREDNLEEDVFSLIGPKKYDVPWKTLERQGWIAQALCTEVRIPMPSELEMEYAVATDRGKYRIAATNPEKIEIARRLVERHNGESILIIGQYLDQLREFNRAFGAPLITGSTANSRRDELYAAFRSGEEKLLIVSKVANFAIDLPDAAVAIEISGSFGSRQEEAQRLGRILRPKENNVAHFYALVSRDTRDQEFGAKRQLFLTEQGYRYTIVSAEDVLEGRLATPGEAE